MLGARINEMNSDLCHLKHFNKDNSYHLYWQIYIENLSFVCLTKYDIDSMINLMTLDWTDKTSAFVKSQLHMADNLYRTSHI